MAKKWSEVASSAQFMALDPSQKEQARSQYFDQVVAPQVPQDKLQAVRSQFDAETRISDLPAVQADRSELSGLTREQRQAQIARADSALDYENQLNRLNQQEGIGRSLALGGRAMLEGLASVPDIVVSPLSAGIEYLTRPSATTSDLVAGRQPQGVRLGTIREGISQLADMAGAPKPQTGSERLADRITSGLTGAATGIGLGNTIRTAAAPVLESLPGAIGGQAVRSSAAPAGSSVAERVGATLAGNPGSQTAASVGASTAGTAASALGAGPVGQAVAELAGGVAGGGATGGAKTAEDALRTLASSSSRAERQAAARVLKEAGQARAAQAENIDQNAAMALQEIAPNINYTPSSVRGVTRTLGEGSNDPAVMALENRLRNQFPDVFKPRDFTNDAARMKSLEKIAGTDRKYQAVEDVRDLVASRARNEAMQAGSVDVSGTVSALDDALAGAEGRSAIEGALNHIRQRLVRETEVGGLTTTSPEDRIRVLENVRKEIGDMLEGKFSGDTNRALAGSRELLSVRDALNAEIGAQVPAFTDYLNAYRRLSRPLNRMDVGRELMNRAGAVENSITGSRALTPDKFARAYNDLDAVAAKATGFKKAKADQILSPQDMDNLRALNEDFSRQYTRNSVAPAGSPTAGLLARGVSGTTDAALSVIPFGEKIKGLGKVVDNVLDNATKEKMAYLMANPEKFNEVVKSLPPKDAEALKKAASQIAYASSISSSENN